MPPKKQGRLFKRKNTYYLQLDVNGKRRTRVIKDEHGKSATRKDVAEEYRDATAQQIRESLSGQTKMIPLGDFVTHWETYLATYRKRRGKKHLEASNGVNLSPSHTKRLRQQIQRFIQFMGNNYSSVKYLQNVTPIHAENYMAELAGGIKDSTYNRYLMALRQAFNVVPETRGNNPFQGIMTRTIQDERDSAAGHRRFTTEELSEMDKNADGWIRPAMFIGYFTGFRLGDVVTLRFSEIDHQGFVLHTERKTSKAKETYAPAIIKYIEEWKPKRILDFNHKLINNTRWMAEYYGVGRTTVHSALREYGELQPVSLNDWKSQLQDLAKKAYGKGHKCFKDMISNPEEPEIDQIPEDLKDYVFPRLAAAYLGIGRKQDRSLPSKEFQRFLTEQCHFKTKDKKGQTILSFHSFRVTYATMTLLSGQTVDEVQEKLKHADSSTTERYVQPTRDEARKQLVDAYRQLPYPGQSSSEDKNMETVDEPLQLDDDKDDVEAKLNELLSAMPKDKVASIIEKWSTQQENEETED